MTLLDLPLLLAQLPEGTMYANPAKLLVAVGAVALWALFAQWLDKDAVRVNTYRILWNLISMSTGIVALGCLFFVPNFWAALAAFVVVEGGFMIAYVVHRNGLVEEESKVGTPAHLQRLMSEGFGGKKKEKIEVTERVRLTAADRKRVSIPVDEVEREQYRLSQDMLFDAVWRRASLCEVTPAGQASRIAYLVDGLVVEREPMPRPEADSILVYLKKLAGLNLEERRRPQSGKLSGAVGDNKFDIVVKSGGSTAGEKLQLRFVGGEKGFKFRDLGFTEKQVETVQNFMQADSGLVLLSAPRGHGLTTTVYSFARSHDAFLLNIQMLEFNRELDVENITQKLHEPSEERTFTQDLQKLVRTDPNVIVLPELRDRQSAVIASQAAAEKQKVYVALAAADVWDAFKKWLAMVGDAKLSSKSLLAVLHQRLVRVLCTACKTPYKPDSATLRKMNLPADKVLYRPPEPQVDKHGNPILCQACQGTGYVGRTGVFQIVAVDDGLRQVLRQGGSINDIQSYCLKQGGLGLQQQALQKVFDGVTSIEEVIRVTRPPAAPPAAEGAPRPAPGSGAAQAAT